MGTILKNGIPYGGGGGGTDHRTLTQAEYDALSTEEKNNGTIYLISDGIGGNNPDASQVVYSNTSSGLSATSVQGAIDTLGKIVSGSGTASSLITSAESLVWIKAGRLCQIYLMFRIDSAVGSTDILVSGLPKPLQYVRVDGIRVTNGTSVRVGIMPDGTLRNAYDNILGNSDTNKQIQISAVYLLADSEL